MEKSSKKSREERGEHGKDHHRHHAGDGKRSSRDERRHDSDRLHSRDYHRDSKQRQDREDREGSRDRDARREKFHDSRDEDRQKSRELRDDRELDREECSRGREASMERKHKRKDRERGEEVIDGEEKRPRVYEGDKKPRSRFEDGSSDQKVERRERRKFGDKANEEVSNGKDEVSDGRGAGAENDGVAVNGAPFASSIETPKVALDTTSTSRHPIPTKVSSITTANENTGVSIRSHEVPGKTSTDGTSSVAGKSGSLSLDALAKAKKALQMQKELSAKLKKIPLLNKTASTTSSGAAQVVQKDSNATRTVPTGLPSAPVTTSVPSVLPVPGGIATVPDLSSIPNYEAVKRAQELAAKMGFRQDPQFAPLINLFPGATTEIVMPQKPTKAPVLRLDALGREIDEHGNVVNLTKPSNLSTLKVNINKQKKDAFQILKPELEVDPESNPHFDARMGIDKVKLLRPKRMAFQFVEEGKWSKDAEMMKLRSQFGEARAKEQRAKQAQLAKAKAAPDINPNLIEVSERVVIKEKQKDHIPEVEWWDVPILLSGTYDEEGEGSVVSEDKLKMEKITIYVEHPRPIEPPAEAAPPPPQPLKLTKKEQKKLRTQRRLAREKERQEMIRQGLIEAPKSKVKMSNLMRVLGAEATQDPTKLEREIRTAAAEREQAHVDRNIARKLTPAERREKKERKLFDDPSNTVETIVSVYRINDLSHKKTRFKVDVNAHENRLTGCAVISDGINVVVVEGGSKSIKRYGKLMLKRIDWAAAKEEEEEDGEDDDDGRDEKQLNKCVLVWQGSVARPSFNRFMVHECMTDAAARKVFADAGVGHYWDLAVNFPDDQV